MKLLSVKFTHDLLDYNVAEMQIRRKVKNGINRIRRRILKDLSSIVQHWKHEVIFTTSSNQMGDYITLDLRTDDPEFNWLNYGTIVKRAKMEDDFMPKTFPGSLRTSVGRGKMLFYSRRLSFPGIEPRNWYGLLEELYYEAFSDMVYFAIVEGTEVAWHEIKG